MTEFEVGVMRILMLVTALIPLGVGTYLLGPCGKGTYLDLNSKICSPCPTDTFMASDHHQNTECKICRRPKDRKNQEVKITCTREKDAKIGCINGHLDQSQIDGDVYGNNDPDCRPNTIHTEVTVIPGNRAVHTEVTVAPGNKTSVSYGSVIAELNVTPAANYSLHNVATTADTGFLLLIFLIILLFVISVIYVLFIARKRKHC